MARLGAWVLVCILSAAWLGASPGQAAHPEIARFFDAIHPDDDVASAALAEIGRAWRPGYAPIFVDLLRAISPSPGPDGVGSRVRRRLVRFLEQQTAHEAGDDVSAWRKWTWRQPYGPHPDYAQAKAEIYSHFDPRMRRFFPPGVKARIRLDEIDWGGVTVNGIPPLDAPRIVTASAASYLQDDNIVFGLVVNGEARAYPKRVLAWHELARDTVGGTPVTIVYCTLCGTVMPYRSVVDGRRLVLGTSGLLYRSNKLLFDDETWSLWSTLDGTPAVGPLVGAGLELVSLPVVTTRWGEWRRRHPRTTVLSEVTGHDRDYREGAAYRDYFATDDLLFQVPRTDSRLKNKAEVLTMLLAARDGTRIPVAFSVEALSRQPLFHHRVGERTLVVVTTAGGANRVYDVGSVRFTQRLSDDRLRDADGQTWRVEEEWLIRESPPARRLLRVAAQRAFWFGWVAQFPQTSLVRD